MIINSIKESEDVRRGYVRGVESLKVVLVPCEMGDEYPSVRGSSR